MYVYLHAAKLLEVLRIRIADGGPRLPDGVAWHDHREFARRFVNALAARVGEFDLSRSAALREIVHPADPYAAIDGGRVMLGLDSVLGLRDWSEAAGGALAHVIQTSLQSSVLRMGARYLAVARRKIEEGVTGAVEADELVTSHPMDLLVAPALAARDVLEIGALSWDGPAPRTPAEVDRRRREAAAARDRAATGDTTPRTRNGLRQLDVSRFSWQGKVDPALWNWVKPAEPDATPEEVAEALWGSGSGEASAFAYRITAMPPYFGVPKGRARAFPGAAEHAVQDHGRDEREDASAVAFAGSSLASEVASLQAGDPGTGPPPSQAEIDQLLRLMAVQLAHIAPIAAAWREEDQLAATRAFVADKAVLLRADPGQAAVWGPVLRQQQEVLFEVATQLDQLQRAKLDPRDAQAAPYREVVTSYVRAAGTSHLATASRAFLADARERQQQLIGRVVVDAAHAAQLNLEDLRGVTQDTDPERRDLTAQVGTLVADAARVQSGLLEGKAPDADQVDELLVTADEAALRSRLGALAARLGMIEKEAADANDGVLKKAANVFHSESWTLSSNAGELRAKLVTIRARLDANVADATLMALGEMSRPKMLREGHRRAVAQARKELDELQGDTQIEAFLHRAYAEIKDARLRAVILEVGIMIGVSLVSVGIGSVATAAARGFMIARSAETVAATVGLSRTALLGTRLLGLGIESMVNTAGQAAVMNRPVGGAFLEDFLTNLATSGLLHGLHSGSEVAQGVDEAVRELWKHSAGRFILEKGIELTGDTLIGAATGYVVSRALAAGGPLEPATVTSWYLQGAAIAVGRFVHGAAARQLQRLQTLSTIQGWKLGRGLSEEARALQRDAARLEADPQIEAALDLLRRRGELLRHERSLLDEVAANPALARQLGDALGKLQEETAAGLAELSGPSARRLILEGAGLQPAVGDSVWTGTREQIDQVVEDAHRAGIEASLKPGGEDGDSLTIAGVDVRVVVHHGPASARPRPGAPAEAGAQPAEHRGRGLPSYPIARNDIKVAEVEDDWQFLVTFNGMTHTGKRVFLGTATVRVKNGRPFDAPTLDLKATLVLDGKPYAVKIHEGVQPVAASEVPAPVGERTSLSTFAVKAFIERYKARFGHEPKEFESVLVERNRLSFQKEYVKARARGVKHKRALIEAAQRTSFGESRIAAGYTDFRVRADRTTEVVDLEELGFHAVPVNVTVTARRP